MQSGRAGVLAILVMTVAGALLYATEIRNYELWWHMATGRWVVEHLAVPDTDPFSYTFQGRPWLFVNWLGGLILYGWWCAFGESGLVPLKMLTMFASGVLLALGCRRLGVRAAAAAAAAFATLALAQPRYAALRPMVQGTVPLAGMILLGAWYQVRPGRGLWWAVPIILVWSQLHGTVMIGLGILGVLWVAGILERRPARDWVRPLIVLLTSVLVMLTTNSGRAVFEIVRQGVTLDSSIRMMDEWAPMSLDLRFVWVPWMMALIGGMVTLRHRRLYALGLVVLGAILAGRFVRNLYEALFLFAPAFAIAVDVAAGALERLGRRTLAASSPYLVAFATLSAQVALIPSQFSWSHRHFDAHFGLGVNWAMYPRDTYPTLAALPAGRTIHEIMSSGYLIWERIPGGVFADGRTTALYDGEWMTTTYAKIDRSPGDLKDVADEYDVHYGLADWARPICTNMMVSDWTPIHYGESSVVFVRDAYLANLPDREALDLGALRYLEPLETHEAWLDAYYQRLTASEDGRRRLEEAMERALSRHGHTRTLDAAIAFIKARGYLQ